MWLFFLLALFAAALCASFYSNLDEINFGDYELLPSVPSSLLSDFVGMAHHLPGIRIRLILNQYDLLSGNKQSTFTEVMNLNVAYENMLASFYQQRKGLVDVKIETLLAQFEKFPNWHASLSQHLQTIMPMLHECWNINREQVGLFSLPNLRPILFLGPIIERDLLQAEIGALDDVLLNWDRNYGAAYTWMKAKIAVTPNITIAQLWDHIIMLDPLQEYSEPAGANEPTHEINTDSQNYQPASFSHQAHSANNSLLTSSEQRLIAPSAAMTSSSPVNSMTSTTLHTTSNSAMAWADSIPAVAPQPMGSVSALSFNSVSHLPLYSGSMPALSSAAHPAEPTVSHPPRVKRNEAGGASSADSKGSHGQVGQTLVPKCVGKVVHLILTVLHSTNSMRLALAAVFLECLRTASLPLTSNDVLHFEDFFFNILTVCNRFLLLLFVPQHWDRDRQIGYMIDMALMNTRPVLTPKREARFFHLWLPILLDQLIINTVSICVFSRAKKLRLEPVDRLLSFLVPREKDLDPNSTNLILTRHSQQLFDTIVGSTGLSEEQIYLKLKAIFKQ